MKKLFTLIAFLAMVLGANAEIKVDKVQTWSGNADFPNYIMGYAPPIIDGILTDNPLPFKKIWRDSDSGFSEVEAECTPVTINGGQYYLQEIGEVQWRQYFLVTGIATDLDGTYTVTAKVRVSQACDIPMQMRWSWSADPINYTAHAQGTGDWEEVEWIFANVGGTSCDLIAQPGTTPAIIEWMEVKVTHDEKAQRPVEWIEHIVNGDASGEYGEVPCAQQIYKPVDMEIAAASGDEIAALVKASPIEELDGEKVFACHTPAVDKSAYTKNVNGDDVSNNYAWANQFFIVSPVAFKEGETIKVSFDYKATEPANTNTQAHGQPTRYQDWQLLGDVKFTTEWQHLEKEVTLSAAQAGANGMYSVAFNLNPDNQNANTFYFKNLSVMTMKLDNGFFVASTSAENSIDYDFDNAVELVYDEAEDALKGVVGTVGKKDSWVNEIMISTVRGNDKAFRNKTIKPKQALTNEDWINYETGSNAKIKLPAAGVYEVYVAEEDMQMMVRQLEGDEIIAPVDIVPNPEVVVIKAVERDYTAAEAPEGYEFPKNDEGKDITGQPWDNQFCIMANRPLMSGEETVIAFDYVATKAAKANTQVTSDVPGGYLYWNCIGDVEFTTEEQHLEKTYKIPFGDGSAELTTQSITFNMAVIKEANEYTIKNIVWKTADGSETLIDMEGTKNFLVKTGANTGFYEAGTDGILEITTDKAKSNAVYNIAGQRVSNTFKGVAIKNGQKYIVK